MPTKRKPIIRPAVLKITPRAVAAYQEWRALAAECICFNKNDCSACKRRVDLHEIVNDELQLKPWEWCWQYNQRIVGLLERGRHARRANSRAIT